MVFLKPKVLWGLKALGGFFSGWVKRPYVQLRVKEDSIKPEALITGQTEGLKVACEG
jgi:hypothetical protein